MELMINELVMSRIIERKSNDLISQEEVQDLTFKIDAYCKSKNIKVLSYSDFKQLQGSLDKRYRKFFKANVFLRLSDDRYLNINRFSSFIVRKESLYEARLAFACYDSTYTQSLTIADLKGYLMDQIKDIPEFDALSSDLQEIYLQVACKKFLILLGTDHHRRIRIQDMLLSQILTEFLEVRENYDSSDKKWEQGNFFAISTVMKMYNKFKSLDGTQKQSLNAAELFKYGTFNALFLERYCEEYGHHSRLNFDKFTELILIHENYSNPHIIHSCFETFDVNKQGYIGAEEVKYFLDPIVKKLNNQLSDKLDTATVTNELMDALLVKGFIRKKDFKLKFGSILLKILCTKGGLVEYYNSFASS
eukprot:NODE_547_length_6185_cov_0.654124.p2 type:complete len:362 gc:universal NODE_547_length_6185_cov_0.654124:3894-4979(+)